MDTSLSALHPTRLARFLYNHNPFYLIGTLLVLYGAQQSLGQQPSLATSMLLVEVLACYTLGLALVAVVIIHYGQIWEDARTILLLIVLMFFMLSTSMDFHFLFTLVEPWPGTWLLAAGWVFSFAVSECLLIGLRIRLAANYRLAYHLVLALLFGYPVLLGWMNYHSYYGTLPWALLAFPTLGALALLTLLPAARTLPEREPRSGTPWIWPYYPWSLFVFLTLGLGIRAWWLTISFQPAKESQTIFGLYFLLPLILAWAALVLEMGMVRKNPIVVTAAMLLPLIAVCVSIPEAAQSATEVEFLGRLSMHLGSPSQLCLWSLLGFYGWAWLRSVPAGEGLMIAAGLLTSVIGAETRTLDSITSPEPLVLAAMAIGLFAKAVHSGSTLRAFISTALAVVAVRLSGAMVDGSAWLGQAAWFWQWHAPVVAMLAIPAVFNDRAARALREIAWPAVPAVAACATVLYPWLFPQVPELQLAGYGGLLFLVSIGLWLRQREVGPLAAALATFIANPFVYLRSLLVVLGQTPLASGLPWLASGLGMVLLALAISLWKIGFWQRIWQAIEQINAALRSRPLKGLEK